MEDAWKLHMVSLQAVRLHAKCLNACSATVCERSSWHKAQC